MVYSKLLKQTFEVVLDKTQRSFHKKTISNVRTISMEMSDFIHIQNVIGLPLMMSDTITLKRGNNKANLNHAIRVRAKSLEIKLWSGSSTLLTLKTDELVRKCWSLNKYAVPVSIRFNFIYNNGGTENVSVTVDLTKNV